MDAYGNALRQYRQGRGISQRALAREIGLNPTLVNRSEAGDRGPGSPDEVASIARALKLTASEHDHLLVLAGYWPAAFLALGPADPTLRAVARALTDTSLPEDVRADIRQGIEALMRAVTTLHQKTPTTGAEP